VPAERRPVVLLAWITTLTAVLAGALAGGHGALAGPDLGAPGTWREWAATRTPAEAVAAVGRLLVVVLAGYLLVVTIANAVAVATRAARALTVLEVVTLPVVHDVVRVGLGVGLASVVVAAFSAGTAPSPRPTAADVALVADAVVDDEPPVLRRAVEPSIPTPRTWTVEPGDHFWSIASRVLADAWGRPPLDPEVVPYWEAVIAGNRDRLADPHNADLLFPGQVLVVPAPPPSP